MFGIAPIYYINLQQFYCIATCNFKMHGVFNVTCL